MAVLMMMLGDRGGGMGGGWRRVDGGGWLLRVNDVVGIVTVVEVVL